ncbi:MAG TPA: hypothetical protein VF530_13345 [Planctomycetota bacterium]
METSTELGAGEALEEIRLRMLRGRARALDALMGMLVLGLGVPLLGSWIVLPLWVGSALPWALLVLAGLGLVSAVVTWSALYRLARATGGARYALSQTLLSVALPIVGLIAIPLLVDSDVQKGVAAWRARTREPLWFTAWSTLLIAGLLVLAHALVVGLGLWGLALSGVALPLVYFLAATCPRGRGGEGGER